MKKIISIALTLALLLTTCLVGGVVSANAETSQQWLEFEAKEFTVNGGTDYAYWTWTNDGSGTYPALSYMGYDWPKMHNQGATIRRYVVPDTTAANSTLRIVSHTYDGFTGAYAQNGYTMRFAITDKTGKIIYPTNGQIGSVTGATGESFDISLKVNPGDEINFLMMNPNEGNGMYGGFCAQVILNGNYVSYYYPGRLCDPEGKISTGGQGYKGWYYMYADSVSVSNFDPNASTDNGGDIYTATYTVSKMTNMKELYETNAPNTGYLANGLFETTTFAQSMNIYPKAGETAIVRYTAPEFGYFDIGYCGVELINSWSTIQGVDFAIVDSNGTVIYPEYGGPSQLRGGDNPNDHATVPSRLYHYNMEAGDYLDFVFKPTATTPNTRYYVSYVQMAGSFSFNGERVDSSGRLNLDPAEAQGKRGVTMLYSTDFAFEKQITDEWKEYVQLSKSFKAAPATIEAYVNIPTNVPDWKQGVILSDMGGADETNGFKASVDYFGHPRLTLAGGAVDVIFDAVDLRTGKWEHIAYTYDAASGEAKFYLNGALADSKTVATATLSASSRLPVVGNDLTYTKSFAFQGAMKKLAVFSDVRTADEIAADMAGVSASADALIGYWMLNGGYDDKSSNGNTGVRTNVGSAWYKDAAPADAEEGEFTIVHTGDQQVVTDFIYGLYPKITEWIVNNKERLNIKSVVNTGDLVNNEDQKSQWNDALNGTNMLLNAEIPYIFAPGNHEYPASGTKERNPGSLKKYFPITTYLNQGNEEEGTTTQIVATYPNTELIDGIDDLTVTSVNEETGEKTYAESIENAVYVQTIGGKTFIYFVFEVMTRDIVVEWANKVMPLIEDAYPGATTIIATHSYLTAQGQIDPYLSCFTEAHRTECNSPVEFYNNFVKKYKSISLVLCGHVASDIVTRTDIGDYGNKIVSVMNDASYEGDGGQGVLLLLRFKADGTIKTEYYSPLLDAYYRATSQFEFDAENVETKLSLPTMTEMGWARTGNTNDPTWFQSSNLQGGHYVQYRAMKTYNNYAVSRTYKASVAGSMSYTINVIQGSSGVNFALCRDDGTILWPQDGMYQTETDKQAFQKTVVFDVKEGEKIHLIVKRRSDKTNASYTHYAQVSGSITPHDAGASKVSFASTDIGSTQGENGWYAYEMSASGIKEVAISHTVNYSAGEGGTITAQTGGTWGKDKLTIEDGGSAYFTTKPSKGYRFAGYFVNGQLISTGRKLVIPNISSNMVVEARFEKIKIAGDANLDGVVNILDLVLMHTDSDQLHKEMVDLEDDNTIDLKDMTELRIGLIK